MSDDKFDKAVASFYDLIINQAFQSSYNVLISEAPPQHHQRTPQCPPLYRLRDTSTLVTGERFHVSGCTYCQKVLSMRKAHRVRTRQKGKTSGRLRSNRPLAIAKAADILAALINSYDPQSKWTGEILLSHAIDDCLNKLAGGVPDRMVFIADRMIDHSLTVYRTRVGNLRRPKIERHTRCLIDFLGGEDRLIGNDHEAARIWPLVLNGWPSLEIDISCGLGFGKADLIKNKMRLAALTLMTTSIGRSSVAETSIQKLKPYLSALYETCSVGTLRNKIVSCADSQGKYPFTRRSDTRKTLSTDSTKIQ